MGILTSFFNSVRYVRLSPDHLSVRDPKSGKAFSEPPEVAISLTPKVRIVGIGVEARMHATAPSVEILNPFAHPRSLVSDFTVGEQLLKASLARINGGALLSVAPRVVMHPLGNPAGGFTQVEIRAFHEMALGAGAGEVKVWQGRELTDQELLSGTFPADGKLLA
jgi:rod shape-determining protein MreB